MPSELQQLEVGIQALEARRALLGDGLVDMAVAPIKAKPAALQAPPASDVAPAQTLRQVSILYLDVVGSTTLAQRLDLEEVSAMMDGALSRGITLVQAHRGRMLQYAGDNIRAACGVDESSEDDTERAMHWADDESLEFLNYLAEVNRDMPLLLLTFTRPTLFERRSDWRSGEGKHERIDLYLLQPTARRELVNELLKKLPEVPVTLTALIVGRAEGNPFYMQELVRMLIDQVAIDASGEPWRLIADRLLATQVFWDRALLALNAQAEAALPRPVQRELALPSQDAQPDGLREYSFKHAMLHQVTYGTVLKRHRKVLHGKLADWLAAPRRPCGMARLICYAHEPQTEEAPWRDCSRTETGRLISVCCRRNDCHVTHKPPA